jgi:hypothetical protein
MKPICSKQVLWLHTMCSSCARLSIQRCEAGTCATTQGRALCGEYVLLFLLHVQLWHAQTSAQAQELDPPPDDQHSMHNDCM